MREIRWVLIVALAFYGSGAFAQNQRQNTSPGGNNPNQPIGAGTGVGPLYDASPVSPDKNTLGGAAPLTLGSLEPSRNIFDPSLSATLLGQTFPGSNGQMFLTGESIIGGNLNYIRTWRRYRMTTVYNGGETVISCNCQAAVALGLSSAHFPFHDLSFTQEADWAKWHLLLRDDFLASPGASFTGQGMGGPGLLSQASSLAGSSVSGFGQAFLPGETVNTGYVMRYRNAVLGQAEYSITRKSVLTFSGSYGMLHFFNAGYISSTMVSGQVGYDYLIDPMNSVAILASYGKIDYTGTGVSTTGYAAALAYGRKITGRLALQVAGGPQKIFSYGAGGVGNFQLLFFSGNAGLTYALRRSSFSLNYLSGMNGGSGVLRGSTANTMSGSASYVFSRLWVGSLTGGYAINESLAPAGVATVRFDNWYSGASLGLLAGPHLRLNLNYGMQKQMSPAVCPVASCGTNAFQQTFGMNFNWHLRPVG